MNTDSQEIHDEEALVPLESNEQETGPSSGLLSFYDRLRDRILAYVDRHGGRLGSKTAEALLLVPDVFMLMARLALDKEVPQSTRMLVGGALAYFVLPTDFLPEAFVGPTGYLDDLILSLVVLAHVFGDEIEPFAEKYWSGSRSLRSVLRDVLSTANMLLSDSVYDRLRDFLSRRGINLDDFTEPQHETADEPA